MNRTNSILKRAALRWPLPTARRICALGMTLVAVCVLSAGAARGQKSDTVTDQGITRAVETDLTIDPAVSTRLLDISTQDGIVTLSGTVDNLLSKERAVKIAQTIRGVQSVVDRIEIAPPPRADHEIRKDIEMALSRDPATDSYDASVTVKNGVATLTGRVQSWQERQLAAHVTKGVKGVKAIENNLDVEYTATRSDSEIRQEIVRRLESDVWVNGPQINVTVHDGEVRLSGTVGSAYEKSRAYSDAWVGGTVAVNDDDLKVRNWERAPMRRAEPADRSDEEIKTAVEQAFVYDPRVLSFNPKVEVAHGQVTLSGIVDNLKAKSAALEDALNTVGVVSVRDFLKVRPKTAKDATVAADIRQAFAVDPFLEKQEIKVSVVNGKAYLTGVVGSSYKKRRAEEVASRVNGVAEIESSLAVAHRAPPLASWGGYGTYYGPAYYPRSQPGPMTDAQIARNIEDQFFWSPFVDGDNILVKVKDGVATLNGEVSSRMERGAAVDNAYEGGAIDVRNELVLAGSP